MHTVSVAQVHVLLVHNQLSPAGSDFQLLKKKTWHFSGEWTQNATTNVGSFCMYWGTYYIQLKNYNETIKPPGKLYCLVPLILLSWRYLQKDPKCRIPSDFTNQRAKNVVSNSPGQVDFAIELVNSVLNGNSNFLLGEMTFGLIRVKTSDIHIFVHNSS